ncbi:MAG: DUF4012 domain-containing protein [Microbacterium sp.]|uniref:DUF4012 domain-containing protein n=1 Tax=Microbacterium sp. TaxID=51671 RepID=UPI0039E4BD9C
MSDEVSGARRRAWIGWTVFGVAVVVLFVAAWVAVRAIGAGIALAAAEKDIADVRTSLAAGLPDDAAAAARRVEADVANARALTADPVWGMAEGTPWLGGSLRAARQISEIADDLAKAGLPPLIEASRGLDLATLGVDDGHIDLAPLDAVATSLADADAAFDAARRRLRDIDTARAIPPLGGAVDDLVHEVDAGSAAARRLAAAADLAPVMLGGGASRTYLLVVQDNGQLRSSGGAPRILGLIRAKDGTVSLTTLVSSAALPAADKPVAKLPAAVRALFGQAPARRIRDALSAPDFATGARLAAAEWKKARGGRVHGVVAIDTVALARLLEATGSITVGGVELTAENAAGYLSGGLYEARPKRSTSDAFLRSATSRVFARLTGDSVDARDMLAALVAADEDGRVRLWSADSDLQKRIATTTLAGALPGDDAKTAHVGVLANDTTGGRIDSFARAAVTVHTGVCDGRATARVTVDWSNRVTADAAASLPALVTGRALPAGTMGTRVALLGPEGWRIASGSATGEVAAEATTEHGERPVVQYELRTPPGGAQSITVDFVAAGDALPTVDAHVTPMAEPAAVEHGELACG